MEEKKRKQRKKTKKEMEEERKVEDNARFIANLGRGEEQNFDSFYMPFKSPIGRPLKYQPEELVELFAEYVVWCREHPLEAVTTSETRGTENSMKRTDREMRPRLVSISGFLVYIGGLESWWRQLDNCAQGEIFLRIKEAIGKYCENYQVEMASAGFFKQNIISRLLGLTDKKEVAATGEGVTIIVKNKEEKDKLENIGDLGV